MKANQLIEEARIHEQSEAEARTSCKFRQRQ